MITNKIQCPRCTYSGGDLNIGRTMPSVHMGYMKIMCSACKNEFRIKILYECY